MRLTRIEAGRYKIPGTKFTVESFDADGFVWWDLFYDHDHVQEFGSHETLRELKEALAKTDLKVLEDDRECKYCGKKRTVFCCAV